MKKLVYIIVTLTLGLGTNAQVCFAPSSGSPFAVGSAPFSTTSADFNGDGKSDLAVANRASDTVSVLLGFGGGIFGSAAKFAVGSFPYSIISADFNGDSKVDLAVANNNSNNVSILLGNGTGSFAAAVNFTVGTAPFSVTSADFNGDLKVDLAVANSGNNTVSLLFGNGTGSFAAAVNFIVGSVPVSIIKADFNGDGKADLATTNNGSNNVSILMATGTGSFATAVNFAVGVSPFSVTSADFNGDLKADLAVANYTSNTVSLLLGNGVGSFATAVNFAVGTQPISITSVDFNGDLKVDLAVANKNSNDVSVLMATGTGSFTPALTFTTGAWPRSITSADFDADGKADLAVANNANNNVSVLLNCTASCTIVPTANISSIPATCFGICNGSATITANGGGPFTYSWTGSASTSSVVNGLCAGSYSCTVTNSCGLSVTKNVLITQPSAIILNTTISNPVICLGNSTALTVSASGGTGSTYSYSWSTGSNLSSINVTPTITPTSTYTINATDLNGCLATKILSITVNPSPTITVTPVDANMCAGKTNTINLSGAVNYTTNPGGITLSSFTVAPSSSTTYSVTGINAQGCIGYATGSINVVAPPTIASNVNTNTICQGSVVTFSNSGGVTYTLMPSSLSGSVINFTSTIVGTTVFTVAGTGPAGCINTKTISITTNSIPNVSISPSNTVVCTGNSVVLNATGATTYNWNTGSTASFISLFPTASSIYSVVGTNSFGCAKTATAAVNVIVTPTLSVSSPSTNVCQGYTMIVTASGATNYQWSTGATTNTIMVQPFFTTTYSVIGSNGGTCNDTAYRTLTVLALPTISAFASPTLACPGYTINLSASGNTSNYYWQPGALFGSTQTVTINSPTTYTAYGQGSNGCWNLSQVFVDVKSITSVTPVVTPSVICAGSSAILSVIGGYVPAWISNSVPNTSVVTPTINTTYTVSAKATNGCVNDITFNVIVNQDCALTVYNAFSPNDDGLNDRFFIGNIEHFNNNKVFIYNRWGNKIFETVNYNNTTNAWNGKLNGESVPNGTYFYIINFNDGKDFIKSWVEVTN